jgi:vancomycin aglycone glucosyltransferase
VRVCAPADEDFVELLGRAEVPLVPIGRPMRSMVPPASSAEVTERVAELISTQYDTIFAAAEGVDVVVATGLSHFAARSAAEKRDIPYVYALFCPVVLPSSEHSPISLTGEAFPADVTDHRARWELNAQRSNDLWGPALNAHRASIGLPSVHDAYGFIVTEEPWLAADPTLGPWPEHAGLEVVLTGAWILPDERPLPAELEKFLAAGEPPVYVGFGSMRQVSADLARVSIEVIRGQGRRALVGQGWADLALIDHQEDCFVIGEVNQQALFGRVAAVVHHGGAGTTTTAARAGAPQVIIPQAADQTYWAGRVAELGIGAAHDGPVPTADSLDAALGIALTAETRSRAIDVSDAIRTDGATSAARILLEALSRAEVKA